MAQFKNTTISDTGFLQLPQGTTGQRPTVTNGKMRYNTTTNEVEVYSVSSAQWLPSASGGALATGGTVYDVDVDGTTYRVHVFTTVGNSTFTVTRAGPVEYLIVAGGGGGGFQVGGGGGAGGLLTGTTTVTPQAYIITVGGGGNSTPNSGTAATSGGNSSAFGLTAIGGGRGANHQQSVTPGGLGATGGSGGGGSGNNSSVSALGGAGTAGQGNSGGRGRGPSGPNPGQAFVGDGWAGGGGGGAGFAAGDSVLNAIGGRGGNGLASSITGTLTYYAGGGGGGSGPASGNTRSVPGLGGGGIGLGNVTSDDRKNGTPNTGGGGGGVRDTSGNSGAGGSGIVIVRYVLRQANPTATVGKTTSRGLVLDLDFAKSTVYTGTGAVTSANLNGITGTVNSALPTDFGTNRASFSSFGSLTFPFTTAMDFRRAQSVCIFLRTGPTSTAARRNPYNQAYGGSGTITHEPAGVMNYFFGTAGTDNVPYVGFTSSFTVLENETAFVVVTRNQTTNVASWYKNGVLSNTSNAGGYTETANGTNSITIGAGYVSAFVGNLYSVRVYNEALTATEILQMFSADRWRYGI